MCARTCQLKPWRQRGLSFVLNAGSSSFLSNLLHNRHISVLSRRVSVLLQHLKVSETHSIRNMSYSAVERGSRNTLDYRAFFSKLATHILIFDRQ